MKVSIIIPAYNVENYLHRAIESVIKQTYSEVEAIVVDDGSTDNTWTIIQQYSALDNRIRGIKQENHGVSFARNVGLESMTGDYCVFLDSDDWLEENAIERLLTMKGFDDFVFPCCSAFYDKLDKDGKIERILQKEPQKDVVVEKKQALMSIGSTKYNLRSACYKLFDKNVIGKQRFDETIFHGEDGLFVFNYIRKIEKIIFSTEPLWNILERPGSATSANFNKKWLTAITAAEKMMDKIEDEEIYDALVKNVVDRTEIVEKEIFLSKKEFSEELYYTRNKLYEYKRKYLKLKISSKERVKLWVYTSCPTRIAKFIVTRIK